MAGRIRSIKPELREHAGFASLSDGAARLFLMLYTLVDDTGVCPGGTGFLQGAVFFRRPKPLPTIGRLLSEIESAGLIERYEVASAPFLKIVGWLERGTVTHQRIEKPQPARYPTPEPIHSRNGSGTASGTDSVTDQDLRPRTSDHRPPSEPSPHPSRPLGEASYDPEDPAAIGRLGREIYARLSNARVTVGAELGIPVAPFPPCDGPSSRPLGYRSAKERVREEGADAPRICHAVLDVLIADARDRQDVEWLAEKAFDEKPWRNARNRIGRRRGPRATEQEMPSLARTGSDDEPDFGGLS